MGGGAEIVSCLQAGSAFFTPATCALAMAEAYLRDQKRIFSCAVLLNGVYGIKDLCGGVPVIIGGTGVERVIELSLTSKEIDLFQASVEGVRKVIDTLQPTE